LYHWDMILAILGSFLPW